MKEYGECQFNVVVGLEQGGAECIAESSRRNLTHDQEMAHFALPALERSRGAIVNVGSKVAGTGQGGRSGYAAANGGRNAPTRGWPRSWPSTASGSRR
jgi:NAD(P)-dependent dehydrogenase (short-subunit alcohol dehydrogenase family)